MEQYQKELLKELRETLKSYADMIYFCCQHHILNNEIVEELDRSGFRFDFYCGEPTGVYYKDIHYIISKHGAERLARYTNEIVLYNEQLELYILCVTRYGVAWGDVPANWKN